MRTILVFTRFSGSAFRQMLDGVKRFADDARWSIRTIEAGRSRRTPSEIAAAWRPDGCLVYCPQPGMRIAERFCRSQPTVLVSPVLPLPGPSAMLVRHDSEATGRRVAQEFMKLGMEHFAFIGWERPRQWSEARRIGFAQELEDYGKPCEVFRGAWRMEDQPAAQTAFGKWLAARPRPLAVFAANDRVAEIVIGACAAQGLSVPDDVAVAGCDNDVDICEMTCPTLTSVAPDFASAGFQSAQMLADAFAGRSVSTGVYGDVGIVRRQSTRFVRRSSAPVSAALEYIRLHAVDGIGVADVVARMGCSRRSAEQAFRAAVDKSILGEINDVRLAHAESLLRNSQQLVGAIAQLCGWKGGNYLKRLFKSRHGVTMREWRNGLVRDSVD